MDVDKLQRLKAAKKKVREHKLKKENQKDETPVLFTTDSLTSSVHSNEGSLPEENYVNNVEDTALTNYFTTTALTIDPIAFFDSLTPTVVNTNTALGKNSSDPACTDDPGLKVIDINDRIFNEVPEANDTPSEDVQNFQAFDNITFNNVESLRQLSSQMTQLVNMNAEYDVSNATNDLENRNQELAQLLNNEKLRAEQLNADVEMYKTKLAELEEESRNQRDEQERKLNTELGPLREQLQTHMQTVGILVGEKSELSATLSQCQLMLKQKSSENEELNGRLKTSRARVADLEKELNSLRQERNQYDKLDQEQSEKLKQYEVMKRQKEEAELDISELREKLEIASNDSTNYQKEIQELKASLSLADIKIQQLTSGESTNVLAQVESLTQEKLLLEKHVGELNRTVKTMSQERDLASYQYQQYVQQLNGQVGTLAQKLETVTENNETLAKREQDLVKHIGELERHLQNLQNEHIRTTTSTTNSNEEMVESLENLRKEKSKLEESLNEIRNERDELLKELIVKKSVVEELEGTIERYRVDQPDNAKLLATIESDKVAAARAVMQNNQLKDQLEEMQNAFIKMSNDKMELTEKLESERHQNKEVIDKLQITETNLHKLTEAIEIKDRELTQIREENCTSDKHSLQLSQLEDRLRHYEAQENSYHVLEKELNEARTKIELLTNDLSNKTNSNGIETTHVIDNAEQHEIIVNTINKDLAMKRLEEKFTKTMEDVANLQDEKQSLEHLVLQLQGETETIGEYITLYQHQRAVLKQRAIEKEEQLKRLSADREEMRNKLEKLNQLIARLMSEQNGVPPDILEQHHKMNIQKACTEHAAQIHSENVNEVNGTNDGNTRETAEEIIALLSEIKTSNLVQSEENFHPCPWCSGKLINI